MPKELYEGVAVGMTYVFLALILMISVCAVRAFMSERASGGGSVTDATARPFFGLILVSGGDAASGTNGAAGTYYLAEDVTLGRSASCDIRIKHRDVPQQAARFIMEDGRLGCYPISPVQINGEEFKEPVFLEDGMALRYGKLKLTVKLPGSRGGQYEED
ncbi:MAG: hypothetical protein LBD16_04350 [Oscillospiraceae bacterium]|jgi:hypothetical protein|nr:hypothetical protein [Oscillospiraceae bacterium]